MTPEERAEAIQRFGYREPLTFVQWTWVVAPMACFVLGLVGIGIAALAVGDTTNIRLRGLFGLLVGVPTAWWGIAYLRIPTAPRDNDDFARELRRRGQLDP